MKLELTLLQWDQCAGLYYIQFAVNDYLPRFVLVFVYHNFRTECFMRKLFLFIVCFFATTTAQAVPLQMTHQGRLLEPSGAAVTGLHDLTFRIYDDPTGGVLLWEELITVDFTGGYYAAVLGADEVNNPLDSAVLSLYPIYMELEVDSNGPMVPRQSINSTPYAQMAEVCENVDGGTVNASEIAINGSSVINSSGEWVGPLEVDWNTQLRNIPNDIADGDDNTQLSESQVEGYITNGSIDLASGTKVNGKDIITDPSNCADGQILVFNLSTSSWSCGTDTDATLTANEVQSMIEAVAGLALQAGATVDGSPIVTQDSVLNPNRIDSATATANQVLMYDGNTVGWGNGGSGLSSLNCGDMDYPVWDSGQNSWVCSSTVNFGYLGNLTLSTSASLQQFCNQYTSVYGDLTISGDALVNLSDLHCLTAVYGNLSIYTSTLQDISALASLVEVSGNLRISGTALPSLVGLENLQTVGGELQLSSNNDLLTIDDLTGLTSVGSLVIQNNPSLTSIDGLNQLTLSGAIYIGSNSSLHDITGFANLIKVAGYLEMDSNHGTGQISGFTSLQEITSYFRIRSHFTSITGFTSLTTVGSYFQIHESPNLATVTGFQAVSSIGGDFYIGYNTSWLTSDINNLLNTIGAGNIGGIIFIDYNG